MHRDKNLIFITVTLVMLKSTKINVKISQFKTQCKGVTSHASKTEKIAVFDPAIYKTPDAPLQHELY